MSNGMDDNVYTDEGNGFYESREREKFIFPRSKLNDVIKDSKGKSMLADVGRHLLLKRKDNDLIDITIAEDEGKHIYEMTFFYAGGVPVNDVDMDQARKICGKRFRGMITIPIELEDVDKEDHSFSMMTQIVLKLACA